MLFCQSSISMIELVVEPFDLRNRVRIVAGLYGR